LMSNYQNSTKAKWMASVIADAFKL